MAEPQRVMKIIGFRGFGDHTGVGKSIFLSILFSFFIFIFLMSAAEELLIGNPAFISFFDSGANVVMLLGVTAVIVFFAVFWRHIPLIILLAVVSVAGLFAIGHGLSDKEEKYYPLAIRAKFQPSEERMKEIEALRTVRFARIKDSYFKKDIFTMMDPMVKARTTLNEEPASAGDIVIVTKLPGDKAGFMVKYKGKEKAWRNVSDLAYIRLDRGAFLRHECALLKWGAEFADVVKDIPGGQKVILTGNTSADGLAVEVTHNGDTGWLRSENLKF